MPGREAECALWTWEHDNDVMNKKSTVLHRMETRGNVEVVSHLAGDESVT